MALLFLGCWAIAGKCDETLSGPDGCKMCEHSRVATLQPRDTRCDYENAVRAQTLGIKWGKPLSIG